MPGGEDSGNEYPERRAGDTAVEMAKGLVGSVFPGAAALAALIETAHSRRMATFHRQMVGRVRALEENTAGSLLERAMDGDQSAQEELLSTYSTITRLVQEAMDEEKREALAAAMASSLLWSTHAADVERHYFLRCLSDFEAIHINLMTRARQGVRGVKEVLNAEDSLGQTAKAAWQELSERRMVNRGLDSINIMMTDSGMIADAITPQGARFLQFIGRVD